MHEDFQHTPVSVNAICKKQTFYCFRYCHLEGGKITPEVGTISGDACTGLTALKDGATLELEVKCRWAGLVR